MLSWVFLCITMAMVSQQPATLSGAELAQHLLTVRAQLKNEGLDLGRREALAQDTAAALDRAAQAAADPELRRRWWGEAIELLDQFTKDHPDAGLEQTLRFQAAVFRWAQAQTWIQAFAFEPTQPTHRERAIALLDDAIRRLRAISTIGGQTTLAQNQRFRLAQALADRAELEPTDSEERRRGESEALNLLDQQPAELGLAGFWRLLRADLQLRSGNPAEARRELEAAEKTKPPPPEDEILTVRVPLRITEKDYDGALGAVEGSHLSLERKGLWRVRIRLAQIQRLPEGEERHRVIGDLFREIERLKRSPSTDVRLAMLELARSGVEPGVGESASAWDVLADADQVAGDLARAAAADTKASEIAAKAGRAGAAAGYRLRAGAFWFQAGRFAEADAMLSKVADDPAAGRSRARAGMLRALARGRALATRQPGASAARYSEALERQIQEFPNDTTTHEARWLLGELLADSSTDRPQNRARARSLWSAIPPGAPRWLSAQLATAGLDRDELEDELINPDRRRLEATFAAADKTLADSISLARSEPELAQLLLARARLNLVPTTGNPELARDLCDRAGRLPIAPPVQYRTRLLRMVSLADLGRYLEAEREAQSHPDWDIPAERSAFFDAVRLLDQGASLATTDLRQRRFGLVLRLLVDSVLTLDRDQDFSPAEAAELRMRQTRALLFTGQDREARRSLLNWKGTPATDSDRMLRDLGDTYARLETYSLDIDVQRLRQKSNPVGSPAWFDARYALALAYYRTGQLKDAAQLIDATAILHPELGGGELHDRFIRLRQRIVEKP